MTRELVEEVRRRLASFDSPSLSELETAAHDHLGSLAPLMADLERQRLVGELVAELRGLGPLEPLFRDQGITDILVNPGGEVWAERSGEMVRCASIDPALVEVVIERIVGPLGRRIDRSHPVVDARLPDGSRVCAILPPVAVDGACVAIRRFVGASTPVDGFTSSEVGSLLRELVDRRYNIVVSGGTGTGKTTLLAALAGWFPPSHRVVTVEDLAELQLANPHVLRLECVPPAVEGPSPVDLGDLIRAALRLRPDRLLVGEVRGTEAGHLVQAMNTGHEGSITTCHANDPAGAVRRLVTLVSLSSPGISTAAASDLVTSAVDAVVHVARDAAGARHVAVVAEVVPHSSDGRTRTLAVGGEVVDATLGRCRA